jgi:hypothetical protein
MAETEKRNLKQIGKQWCQQYMSEVTLFIEPQAPSGRRLVAQYEEGSYKDAPEFAAGIPRKRRAHVAISCGVTCSVRLARFMLGLSRGLILEETHEQSALPPC